MSARTIYSVSHFGVELPVFRFLIEVHPKGEYRDLEGNCVVFKIDHRLNFTESWFLDDDDIKAWRGEEE
jgi:hypothetical protein